MYRPAAHTGPGRGNRSPPVTLRLRDASDATRGLEILGNWWTCERAFGIGTCPREHDGLTISTTYGGRGLIQADLSSSALETVTTAIHTLTGQTSGRIDGEYIGTLHPTDVERMLCDATISRVVTGPDGLFPRRRPIPPHDPTPDPPGPSPVRDRDRRYPGCDRPPGWCDAHHIVHWHDGGPTDLTNLAFFCDHHHHTAHQPGWTINFDGHTFTVRRPNGTEIT